MARTRLLSPGFFLDDDLAERSPMARLAFAGLPLLADREGRLEDRPKMIRAVLFPHEPNVDMDELLNELASDRNGSGGGFILRYEANGKHYIEIRNFARYQNPHKKEPPSEIPGPSPGKSRPSRVKKRPVPERPGISGTDRADPDPDPDPDPDTGSPVEDARAARNGSRFWWDEEQKRIWGDETDRRRLREKWLARGFTSEELQAEVMKLNRWLEDRPGKRKHGTNFANRINNWLNTALASLEARESKA